MTTPRSSRGDIQLHELGLLVLAILLILGGIKRAVTWYDYNRGFSAGSLACQSAYNYAMPAHGIDPEQQFPIDCVENQRLRVMDCQRRNVMTKTGAVLEVHRAIRELMKLSPLCSPPSR